MFVKSEAGNKWKVRNFDNKSEFPRKYLFLLWNLTQKCFIGSQRERYFSINQNSLQNGRKVFHSNIKEIPLSINQNSRSTRDSTKRLRCTSFAAAFEREELSSNSVFLSKLQFRELKILKFWKSKLEYYQINTPSVLIGHQG